MTFNHYLFWFEDGAAHQASQITYEDLDACTDGYVSLFGYTAQGFYEYNPSIKDWELVSKET